MKNTLKTKLIAGTTAVALFSGAGFAFANTSAGDVFKNWYDAQFNQAKTSVNAEVTNYALSKEKDARSYYNAEVAKVNNHIAAAGTAQTNEKSGAMNDKAQAHVDSLNAEKSKIMTNMDGQFTALESEIKGIMDFAADEIEKTANNHFNEKATTAGDKAFKTLQDDLNKAKGDANTKLENAITTAKTEVSNALNDKKGATAKELKTYLDGVYAQLKTDVTAIVDGYITAQKDRLAIEASRIEGESTKELDAIVSGINN